MAKVGYIMATSQYDKLEEDRKWMNDFGCVRIVEENDEDERNRPLWKQLMVALQRGDELVISKFSSLPPVSSAKMQKLDREKTVINLYVAGHPIDEVWRASGFRSRSSVFRILNKHGIKLNRGNYSGPIKRKGISDNPQDKE